MMATYTLTVREDGTIRLPSNAARPGETVVVRIERSADAENDDREGVTQPARLTRLTARTPEQKEALRRQIDALIDRLAPMLKNVPDHGDLLYDENGLPK